MYSPVAHLLDTGFLITVFRSGGVEALDQILRRDGAFIAFEELFVELLGGNLSGNPEIRAWLDSKVASGDVLRPGFEFGDRERPRVRARGFKGASALGV